MIDQTKFLELFREQYIGDNSHEILMETDFRKLSSWDSLTGMAVLAMIKDTYDIDVPTEDFQDCKTVQDVYDYVIKKG